MRCNYSLPLIGMQFAAFSFVQDRGAGVFFGQDVTERFCTLNGISLVLRSHECVPEG
jgi:hypothetical protein